MKKKPKKKNGEGEVEEEDSSGMTCFVGLKNKLKAIKKKSSIKI